MTRLVIKGSIDAALMQMKDRKQIEIDEVMQDAKRHDKLTVHDLMRLFGDLGEDSEGKPFIFAEEAEGYGGGDIEHPKLINTDREDEEMFMGNEE